jgi:hypothetical protein
MQRAEQIVVRLGDGAARDLAPKPLLLLADADADFRDLLLIGDGGSRPITIRRVNWFRMNCLRKPGTPGIRR